MKSLFVHILLFVLVSVARSQDNLPIAKVKIKGQKVFEKSMIRDNLTLESTSWFKRKILKKKPILYSKKLYKEDVERITSLYQKEGYLNFKFLEPDVKVTKKQRVYVTIFVEEGSPIKVSQVSFTVDSLYTLNESLSRRGHQNIALQSQLLASKTFRDQSLINDQVLLVEQFGNIGYPYAKVDYNLLVDTLTNTTTLDWTITKGPLAHFGSTIIEGNDKVPDKSIYRQLAYKPGDVWSKKKIDQTQKQIYNQGMYRVASLKSVMSNTSLDTVLVKIQIKEAPRWTTRFGVGYGKEDRFRVFSELQLLGVITHTGRLNFYAKHSYLEPYNVYLKFSQPSVFFPINTFSIYPYLQNQNEPGYSITNTGVNLSMQQNFSKQLNTSLSYVYEDVKQDTTNLSQIDITEYDQGLYSKSGLLLSGSFNNSNPILDPVQGYVASINLKTNGLYGATDMPFYRILAEYKKYYGIRNGLILALKAKGGGINRTDDNPYIPSEERFYAGGSQSVRGWSRSELGPHDEYGKPSGGNSLLEGSAEFRLTVKKLITFALFGDGGNVWQQSFYYQLNDLHYSVGVGVRIKTPIGPAGIDFARPVFEEFKTWQISVNIGNPF